MICAFPGSFIKFHKGHKYILDSALSDGFEKVIVVIARNPTKPQVDLNVIYKKVCKILADYINSNKVEVLINNGLTAIFLKKINVKWIVRGYRNNDDLVYEQWLYKEYLKKNKSLKLKLYKSPDYLVNVRSSSCW